MAFRPTGALRLREALHWSPAEPANRRSLAVAALGMMVPVLAGLASGRLETGFTIGLGAMLLSDAPSARPIAQGSPSGSAVGATADRPSPLSALLPAALAVTVATLICGGVWTDPALVILAGAAAAVSGYSRPVGVAAIRFIVYLVLSVTLLQSAGEHRSDAALIFGLGALWNMVVRRLLVRPGAEASAVKPAPLARQPTPAQRRAYWRRSLRTLSGWQFAIRIVAGLGAASVLRQLWPSHHFGWIVLTVALLTQRPIEHLPVKTIQRGVGTALGVSLTWAIVTWVSTPIWLALLICLLAIAAAVAKARNYMVYAAISTPVILLVLDFGKPIQTSLLTDRLIATVLGAAIVISANVVLDWSLKRTADQASKAAG
jgi:hypothetical protein